MLNLSRKCGQSITIFAGDAEVVVHLYAVERRQVRVGIEAPQEVKIVRTELLAKEAQDGTDLR